jgi:hypothetical protein
MERAIAQSVPVASGLSIGSVTAAEPPDYVLNILVKNQRRLALMSKKIVVTKVGMSFLSAVNIITSSGKT